MIKLQFHQLKVGLWRVTQVDLPALYLDISPREAQALLQNPALFATYARTKQDHQKRTEKLAVEDYLAKGGKIKKVDADKPTKKDKPNMADLLGMIAAYRRENIQ